MSTAPAAARPQQRRADPGPQPDFDDAVPTQAGRAETPTLLPWGEGYVLEWSTTGVRAEIARIVEDKGAFWCEVTWYERVATGWDEVDGGGRLNLLIQSSRQAAAKAMQGLGYSGVDWSGMHEQMAKMVIRRHREGEPSVELWDVPASKELRYLVKPFVVEGEPVVVYGDPGAAKSMFALSLAISLATGADFADGYPVAGGGPVLYLDWETSKETHARRLRRLCEPLGITEKPRIRYRRMAGGLADHVGQLRGEIDRYGIRVCIIDSLGWATADEPQSAAAAIKVMEAARRLGTTSICLAHTTKASRNGKGGATIFGSVFYEAAARATWEMKGKTDAETGNKVLTLYNRKMNEGRQLREPVGIGLDYGGGYDTPITFRSLVLSDGGPKPSTSIADRIAQYLTRVGRATYADIATATGASDSSVRLAIGRKPDEFRKRDVDGVLMVELCAEAIPGREASAEQSGMFSGTKPEESCSVCSAPLTSYDEHGTAFCDAHRPPEPDPTS